MFLKCIFNWLLLPFVSYHLFALESREVEAPKKEGHKIHQHRTESIYQIKLLIEEMMVQEKEDPAIILVLG